MCFKIVEMRPNTWLLWAQKWHVYTLKVVKYLAGRIVTTYTGKITIFSLLWIHLKKIRIIDFTVKKIN